jgi:predicted membrane-bound spermidine synthase
VRRPVILASLVTFIASFCTLVIEIVAGRILAPHVGVSLYTWTSIIGVVLAGISLGAWAGGWLADRRPVPSTLGWLLLASGITALLIAPAANLASTFAVESILPLRVVLLSTLLFFLPSFFLGMISPVAVRLAVSELETAGRVVGKIYAFSTLGSIVGTFTTGFFLVAEFGTRSTMLGVGAVLILSAFIFGRLLGRVGAVAGIVLAATIVALLLFGPRTFQPPFQRQIVTPVETGPIHVEESQYYTIEVAQTISEDDGRPLQALHLDHLVHSYSDLYDPSFLAYNYLQIFHDAVVWKRRQYGTARILFIGGGGYTLPRLIESTWPGATIDVVEIDPAVTRVAQRYFGLQPQTTIRTINEDARWFAMRSTDKYDLIFIDAFNDLSVPYHLTTREFAMRLRELLASDGAIVANLIDNYEKGRFLASYAKTLQSVFGDRNVGVMIESELDTGDVQSTYVVAASSALDRMLTSIVTERALTDKPSPAGRPIPHAQLQAYLREREAITLTDDYVPVDNMLAPLFTDRD